MAAEKLCQLRERISDRIGAGRFRTWFGGATEFQLSGEQLNVTVENGFVGSWITSNYMDYLVEAAREVLGTEPRIDVRISAPPDRVPETDAPITVAAEPGAAAPRADPAELPRTGVRLRDLDTFVVGPCNQLAFSAAKCVAQQPGGSFRLLVLHGGCGLGKTHLLQGLCRTARRERPLLEWRYITGEEFTNDFVSAVKSGRVDAFRGRFRRVDLLVIDDIHFLANKRATQEEFLHTFNAIDASGKAIVLSSDRHPRDLTALSEPLVNRLIAGMIVEIDAPDFLTRREILRRRAEQLNTELSEPVLDYLARRITRNVRELEGALYKIVALAALAREAPHLEMARIVADDYAGTRAPEAADIERLVGQYFGVSPEAIHSKARDRTISLARGVAMHLVRKHTRLSFPEIGRIMGHKNHSTVLMAVRRIEQTFERGGAVAWRTPTGVKQAALRDVLEELERDLARGGRAAV